MKADVLYGDVICKFDFGNLLLKPGALSDFESYFPISHPATLVKGELLKENVFDTSYRISADYELLYRLYHKGCTFEYIPIPLVLFDAITGISSGLLLNDYVRNNYHKKRLLRNKRFNEIDVNNFI